MRFFYLLGVLSLFATALLSSSTAQATHVRAGEITTRRISATSLTYEITLTAYYDEITGKGAADLAEEYTICFGDGTNQSVRRQPRKYLNGRTSSINVYRTTHTYPGPGPFTISVTILNRNADTKNLPPAARSSDISFHVSTTILINANLGLNSSPVMLNPPLDSGRVGQKFCHNPAAFDADGDSLAFRLSVPKKGLQDVCPQSQNIPSYQDPTRFSRTSESGGTPTFSINPRTGDLCWDAPGEEGQYNFAFIVEEWRNGVLIGEITRDMQIVIVDQPNRRPIIQPLADLCVTAGTLVAQPVTATDPDNHRIIINGFGGVFNVGQDGTPLAAGELIPPAYATLTPASSPQNSPATATFRWQTSCQQIRTAPYDVVFKATDVPPKPLVGLVSFQTLRIQLVGPPLQNLTARPVATPSGRAVLLSWDPYTCGATGTTISVYRREGCEPISLSACQTGLPASAGYTRIAQLPLSATSYSDTAALRRGLSYSYRLLADFPDRNGGLNGGTSLASQQACLELPLLAPVITQVSVDSTAQRGRISVRWTRPLGLNPADLSGPYQYRLLRAEGLNGTSFTQIATINTSLAPTAPDTLFVDGGASPAPPNTATNAYRYRVEFYFTSPTTGQLTRLESTEAASSVRLSVAPANRQLVLSWQASTPWSNDNQTHRVYRSRSGPAGPFNLIAELAVAGPSSYTFTDTGQDAFLADGNTSRALSADSSYCYRVLTRGRYSDAQLSRLGLLENYSQIQCGQPTDTTRPCAPRLGLDSLNCASLSPESYCEQTSFANQLRWRAGCGDGVVGYRLYYGRYAQDSLRVLASVGAGVLSFSHSSLSTVAGCYYVTAVNSRGLESAPSNKVCQQACPYFELPNVFTPNGDGKNDVFAPLRCARFVERVELVVYNRWGAKVYAGVSEGGLSWDGRSSEGADLPSGLYYYQVSVAYAGLDRGAPPQVLKGWVQILREGVSSR